MLKYYGYSKCSSCQKAKKQLQKNGKKFEEIDITLTPPSLKDLTDYYKKSGRPLTDFLNKSGEQYRLLNMKEKVKTLSEESLLKMLSENGRLLKRPLVSDGKKVSVGYKEEEFSALWK